MKKIPLRNKADEIVDHALVDDDQFDYLDQFRWHKTHYGYAHTSERSLSTKMRWMHRLVYSRTKGDVNLDHLDHIDRNRLNNQMSNLREVTTLQNNLNRGLDSRNTTGYIGVRKDRRDPKGNRYQAVTAIKDRAKHICYTDDPRDAAIARDIYLQDLYPGEIITLNVPDVSEADVLRVRGIMTATKRRRNASSQYVGVYLDKRRQRWYSQHGGGPDKVFLGYFDVEADAARAFDAYCRANHINRPLNFPL